jgi:SAM-dependent methyltransferase
MMDERARLTSLTPEFVPGGRILEIGCAAGHRLVELRKQGWQSIEGIEMVPAAAERARALGFEVRCARVEEALDAVRDESLDAVVSSMVLEHLYDPFEVLRRVATKLKPGGQFLFSTVVRDSLDARLYGKYWAGFDLPRHMVHFTRQDLFEALHPHFERVAAVGQAAPVDFVRSASWRVGQGEGTILDRIFVAMGQGIIAQALSLLLAGMGRATRVSFYSRRRHVLRHVA